MAIFPFSMHGVILAKSTSPFAEGPVTLPDGRPNVEYDLVR